MTGVAEAVRGYLQFLTVERGLAANTVESYGRDLRRYTEILARDGKTGLDDIAASDVGEFLATLREGDDEHPPLSASSAGRAVSAVRGLHAFAAAEGLAGSDPASPVHPPASPRKLPRAIGVAEVERLIAAAGGGPDGDALRADPALALGLQTHEGGLTCQPVADAHGLPSVPAGEVLS